MQTITKNLMMIYFGQCESHCVITVIMMSVWYCSSAQMLNSSSLSGSSFGYLSTHIELASSKYKPRTTNLVYLKLRRSPFLSHSKLQTLKFRVRAYSFSDRLIGTAALLQLSNEIKSCGPKQKALSHFIPFFFKPENNLPKALFRWLNENPF